MHIAYSYNFVKKMCLFVNQNYIFSKMLSKPTINIQSTLEKAKNMAWSQGLSCTHSQHMNIQQQYASCPETKNV